MLKILIVLYSYMLALQKPIGLSELVVKELAKYWRIVGRSESLVIGILMTKFFLVK